jgi:hypothetical protein
LVLLRIAERESCAFVKIYFESQQHARRWQSRLNESSPLANLIVINDCAAMHKNTLVVGFIEKLSNRLLQNVSFFINSINFELERARGETPVHANPQKEHQQHCRAEHLAEKSRSPTIDCMHLCCC